MARRLQWVRSMLILSRFVTLRGLEGFLALPVMAAVFAGTALAGVGERDVGKAPAEERGLTLLECIDLALQHNLELESGRQTPLIAGYALRGAWAAYEPNLNARFNRRSSTSPGGIDSDTKQLFPGTETEQDRFGGSVSGLLPTGLTYSLGANRVRTDGSNAGGDFLNEDGFFGVDVRQPLLRNAWIDTARLQIHLGRLNLQVSESELRALLMRLITDVEFAYYGLIAARDSLTIIQQSYELAAQLVESHRKQVAVGRMARLDEKQAQARVATSEAALFAAHHLVTERENELKLLITDDFAVWADVAIRPASALQGAVEKRSRESSWRRALTQRPEITQAKLALEREHIRLRFEKNQRFPSLDLTASYGFSGSGRNVRRAETPHYGFGIELNIPIGNGQARARYRAQQLRQRQALIAYKTLEQRVMAEVLNALNAVDSNAQRVTATGQARAFAETALDAEETKLANGKSTNFIVLQLQADLTQARLNETLAIVDYNRALATLALREASTLERHAISLNQEPTQPTQSPATP